MDSSKRMDRTSSSWSSSTAKRWRSDWHGLKTVPYLIPVVPYLIPVGAYLIPVVPYLIPVGAALQGGRCR